MEEGSKGGGGLGGALYFPVFLELPFILKTAVCSVAHVSLCGPMDCSPPGSSIHGILQARILELPLPIPGNLPNPRIEPMSSALQTDSLPLAPTGKPRRL